MFKCQYNLSVPCHFEFLNDKKPQNTETNFKAQPSTFPPDTSPETDTMPYDEQTFATATAKMVADDDLEIARVWCVQNYQESLVALEQAASSYWELCKYVKELFPADFE